MERWNWFLAADFQGKWVTTNGFAEVTQSGNEFFASLKITEDTPVYHEIKACICDANRVEATVSSPNGKSEPFELNGFLFEKLTKEGVKNDCILLTDGSTIIGLTIGPLSHQKNF